MKIAIVGYGSIGKRHETICKSEIPECEIILITRNKQVDSPYNSFTTDSLDHAVYLKPDWAVVASPSSLHIQHALKLVEAGCDCLVEKPIATNFSGIHDLRSVAQKRGCIVQVAYNLRYDPCLIEAKRLINSQLYGPLLSVRCDFGQYLPDWRPGQDYRETVSAKRSLGGGILLEMSHEIDYLSWIVGRPIWVSSWIEKIGKLDIDVEDTALLRIGMNHRNREVVANLSMDFIRQDKCRRCDFICENATIQWDGIVSTLTVKASGSSTIYKGAQDRNFTYRQQLRDFLNCITHRKLPSSNIDSGIMTLKTIQSSRLSSLRSGIKCYL